MLGNKLFLVKSVHILLFIFMTLCVIYILFSSITKTYHWTLFIAIGAVLIEGIILMLNHWQCPLTNLAKKHGDEKGSVTDIFFPAWFVPHVFKTYAVLFVVGLVLLAVNYVIA